MRELVFERHLALLQNEDYVQKDTTASGWRTEELRKQGEREARKSGKMNNYIPSPLSNDFAKSQATA